MGGNAYTIEIELRTSDGTTTKDDHHLATIALGFFCAAIRQSAAAQGLVSGVRLKMPEVK